MLNYDEIIGLINDSDNIVDFGTAESSPSSSDIGIVEKRLMLPLPPSYIWWLKNYGGGEILGDEVFSVYGEGFDSIPGGDITYMYQSYLSDDLIRPYMLPIMGGSDLYYLDTRHRDVFGEYPVYKLNRESKYADNFLDFLKKQITGID